MLFRKHGQSAKVPIISKIKDEMRRTAARLSGENPFFLRKQVIDGDKRHDQ
jgi:hypothetical protein